MSENLDLTVSAGRDRGNRLLELIKLIKVVEDLNVIMNKWNLIIKGLLAQIKIKQERLNLEYEE